VYRCQCLKSLLLDVEGADVGRKERGEVVGKWEDFREIRKRPGKAVKRF